MKRSIIVYIHIAFWLVILATRFVSLILTKYLSPEEFGLISLYVQLLPPVFFYIGYLGVMSVRWEKKYLLLPLIGIIFIYLMLFLISKKAFAYGIAPISSFFLWTTIGCLFRFFVDWFKKKNDVIVLEKENIGSNLALLKTQISPHFLFNTLHNVDALIHTNQKKASKSLVKLSDIMRYMLTDAKSDFVELEKEIKHIENYLSLEKLRLKNDNFLNYKSVGRSKGLTVAPMIMIPFVENAFKHSLDSSIDNGINIEIKVENERLNFVCENQFDASDIDKDKTHGIGLETVQKRLELIYHNKYKLLINSENSVFKVYLEIELDED